MEATLKTNKLSPERKARFNAFLDNISSKPLFMELPVSAPVKENKFCNDLLYRAFKGLPTSAKSAYETSLEVRRLFEK